MFSFFALSHGIRPSHWASGTFTLTMLFKNYSRLHNFYSLPCSCRKKVEWIKYLYTYNLISCFILKFLFLFYCCFFLPVSHQLITQQMYAAYSSSFRVSVILLCMLTSVFSFAEFFFGPSVWLQPWSTQPRRGLLSCVPLNPVFSPLFGSASTLQKSLPCLEYNGTKSPLPCGLKVPEKCILKTQKQ